jgi:hypothetical protein
MECANKFPSLSVDVSNAMGYLKQLQLSTSAFHECICKDNSNHRKACVVCSTGKYGKGGSECEKCPKGKYGPWFRQESEQKGCRKCPSGKYNDQSGQKKCKPCVRGTVSTDDRLSCKSQLFDNIFKKLQIHKEKQNDLSLKNSRLWQKERIRINHDKLMQGRRNKDNQKEKNDCKLEKSRHTIIFPAIEISNEIEKIEDTTCIDTNRDELLKSFCSFTSDLDNLFHIQSIPKEAKSFWPNICCKDT